MKFGIMINEGPYQHQASDSAYLFCKAAHRARPRGGPGVLLSRRREQRHQADGAAAGRPQHRQRWSKLAEEHGVDLVVCVAAALRRGIKDENARSPGFRISGLGQLVESGIKSDRLVVFGD
jgi:tRNA 2-thiouridine synthesizing protein D